MIDEYPIILIPRKFLEYKSHQPSIEEFATINNLQIPKRPICDSPPMEPSKVFLKVKNKIYLKEAGCLPILVMLAAFIAFVTKNMDTELFRFVGVVGLINLLILLRYKKEWVNSTLSSHDYDKLLRKYQSEYLEYQKNVEIFKISISNYYAEMNSLEARFDEQKDSTKQTLYFKKLQPFSEPVSCLQSKRGKHDLFFADKLKEVYPNNNFVDLVPSNYPDSYQPDIVFIDKETKLHIDIEIDEPYTLDKGEPIHFIDCWDTDRDNYFLSENWVVIRFTEKQVIHKTASCCKLIKAILENIKYGVPIDDEILEKEKKWNFDEALIMARENYRQKYFTDPKYFFFK